MTEQVLYESDGGSVIAFDESPAERAERIERAAEESSRRFVLTVGQRRVLEGDAR